MKMLATSTPSSSRPPPLPRRSSTIPWAPSSSTLSTWRRNASCAPELKLSSRTTPMRSAVALHHAAGGDRHLDALALDVHGARVGPARGEDLELDLGAGLALDATGGEVAAEPGDRAAVDRQDHVLLADAGSGCGRVVEHVQHAQAAVVLLDAHAHALELTRHRLLEALRLLRREVVRVGVLERLDDPLQRGVVELRLVDRLVEVVLDLVDDLRRAARGPPRRRCPGSGRAASSGGRPGRDRPLGQRAQTRGPGPHFARLVRVLTQL